MYTVLPYGLMLKWYHYQEKDQLLISGSFVLGVVRRSDILESSCYQQLWVHQPGNIIK